MSEQGDTDRLAESAGKGDGSPGETQQPQGHPRRAVMLGAAAVSVGAAAGLAAPGVAQAASKSVDQPAGGVVVKKTPPPAVVQAQQTTEWKTVTIPLTPEQVKELAQFGVNTTAIRIHTFDIARLGVIIAN